MNPRRLYRSSRDRQLAGVAAGMAEYFDIDPTVVRILWILSAFIGGFTIVLYVILAFVIPLDPAGATAPGSWPEAAGEMPAGSPDQRPDQRPRGRRNGAAGIIFGVMLVVFGAIALVDALIPAWAGSVVLGPAFLLALGAALLVGSIRHTAAER
jgi:phage shock protein PspC (stress-responsive transcriptional regulator)